MKVFYSRRQRINRVIRLADGLTKAFYNLNRVINFAVQSIDYAEESLVKAGLLAVVTAAV